MTICEYCKLQMDGIIIHTIKCRKYYDDKAKNDSMRGHR